MKIGWLCIQAWPPCPTEYTESFVDKFWEEEESTVATSWKSSSLSVLILPSAGTCVVPPEWHSSSAPRATLATASLKPQLLILCFSPSLRLLNFSWTHFPLLYSSLFGFLFAHGFCLVHSLFFCFHPDIEWELRSLLVSAQVKSFLWEMVCHLDCKWLAIFESGSSWLWIRNFD